MTVITTDKLTIEQLIKLEPGLGYLLNYARMIGRRRGRVFCTHELWIELFRPRLNALVGHYRGHGPEELRTSAAWDVACRAINAELPDCRGCGCFRLADFPGYHEARP